MPALRLLDPVSDEDVRLALFLSVAIGRKHQLLTVGRKHWKSIEGVVVRYSLQPRAVRLNYIEIKIAASWIGIVRSENYAFAVGKEVRRKAGLVQMCDLPLVRTVRVHQHDLQRGRPDQILFKQRNVI